MNEWLEFVSTHTTASPNAGLSMVAMHEHRILQVSGRDAAAFLQGQLTCDVRRLDQQEVLLGAHCNAKGRMISSAALATMGMTTTDTATTDTAATDVAKTDMAKPDVAIIGLRLRANIAEPALAALKKYIVFSKATITATDQVAIALLGEITRTLPFGELPERGHSVARDGLTLLHHPSGLLEVWALPVRAKALWQELLPLTTVRPVDDFNHHWVDHGIAEVQAATTEEFIPQMLNYHLIDGISFKKGCYTGQEIVARMQYRGQLKKQTYRITGAAHHGPAVGEELVAASNPQKAVALVVASANDAAGWTGLVVAATETYSQETTLMAKNSGAEFSWAALPYAIP